MPPPLALVLCTVFVLVLLRLERRRSGAHVSDASWIPTLWMLAIASKPLGIWFGSAGDAESGSTLDRLVLTGLGLAALAVLVRRRFDWQEALRQHWWLLALLAYMLASTFWSDITSIAVKRWLRDAIVLIMALVIMSEPQPRQALESVLRRCSYILIPFSLMLIKYYPHLGVAYGRWSGEQMWIGVTVQKNTMGRLCMVTAFFLLWALHRRRDRTEPITQLYDGWADAAVLLIAIFLLKGADNAYSATSIGTLAAGIVTFLVLLWFRKQHLRVPRVASVVLVVCLIGYGISTPFLAGSNVAAFSSAFGRNETLTGRTETWSQLVPVAKSRPLLGYGFGSFWTTARRDFYRMSHGHNGYLDTMLELGAIGLALYTAWLMSCARRMHAALGGDYAWRGFALSLLLMLLVYNVTESALNSLSEQMTAMVVLASLVVPYEATRPSNRPHLYLRVHVPQKRNAAKAPAQPGTPKNRRPVRVLGRRGRQRRPWVRTRHSGLPPTGTAG